MNYLVLQETKDKLLFENWPKKNGCILSPHLQTIWKFRQDIGGAT